MSIRYAHTNLIARDWRRLAAFYETLFGCQPVPPERHLAGDWLDSATGLPGAQLNGMHLRLPGYGETGPTLEIFTYAEMPPHPLATTNLPGFAHLAFAVEDVAGMAEAVCQAGGREVGRMVEIDIPEAGRITFQYVADPEGNILELQKWKREE